ncbi:cytochrome ubiquinol oxidase subunit I [Streptococcus iniae]|uniref:cytochrome ubiquinol oxidase subunit I n=1 Tax=Streptococcus iniae TaxID=1346 RepID=UPI000B6135E1|nr:cytochrome ubiquinol oxidase subunit I [Streptococcus iniae]ASL34003.1 cytochrome d ubiquinol oxidase subunit I [Streptococcus iniae]RLU57258.1 cytochrome ubiquinol oxidase subunit I [Streptococcus iniae]RLU67414.1 cytochrome ubiquinol oxidase subunit I [Streptococcus iniae]RLU68494.1 cytochrome ubiquinol oxidase subunit I [Streptococcus iniae]RLU70841.1 cytochrome ubiquinol oxidase subunit I [Streptococcus iniae]
MTIETLARFQFAMTTIFHFFFVPFTIGTCLVVAIMETCYVVTGNEDYKKMTKFWGNIMLLSFAVGVVTGIIQEFQFGMNWSDYSRFVGDIFGAPLAIEALLAFFMESTFLRLWMFTWDNKKISKKMHAAFIWLVVFGSMMSAMWILIANSFMQNPVGYEIKNGRAQMTDFFALVKNFQFHYEFAHVITGAITMGGIVIAGMAAFMLLKKESLTESTQRIYKKSLRLGLLVSLIGSISVMGVGDLQMKSLLHDQPMKFAAMEGDYEDSGDPAAWTVVAWANEADKKQVFGIKIPYMLSILSYGKPSGSVKGMNTVNKELIEKYGNRNYYPMVNLLFYGFRTMAAFGTLMFGVSVLGLFLTRQKNPLLYKHKWMLWIVALTTFAPFFANTFGWVITEQGRYPWTVYGLFTISDSVSPNVSVASLLVSNIVYFLLFSGLGAMMVVLVIRELKKGPEHEEEQLGLLKTSSLDPFEKGAY